VVESRAAGHLPLQHLQLVPEHQQLNLPPLVRASSGSDDAADQEVHEREQHGAPFGSRGAHATDVSEPGSGEIEPFRLVNTARSSHKRQAGPSVVRRPDGRVWIALTKQLDWPPRRRTSPAPGAPSRVPAGTYVVTLDFAEVGGRLECVRFEIGADVDEPNGPDPAPLTASVLRGVPLRELIDQTLFERTKDLRRWAREAGPTGHEARNLRDRVAAAEASLGRAPGRPPMYSDEHFKLVADAYTRAWKISPKPRQAVAAHWHVSPSTAAKWVARARKMGFLPPTERGRPLGGRSPVERTEAKSSPQARRSRKLEEIDSIEAEEAMQRQVVERHDTWLAELTGQPAVDGVPPTASGNTRGQRGVRSKGNTKKERTRKKR